MNLVRMRHLLLVCAALISLGLQAFADLSATILPPGMSVDALVASSNVIFYGRVKKDSAPAEEPYDKGWPSRASSFDVLLPFRGIEHPRDPLTITQLRSNSSPTSKGEHVLWFLRGSLTGDRSISFVRQNVADFRQVAPPSTVSQVFLTNGLENRGLCGDAEGATLWRSGDRRNVASAFIAAYLEKTNFELQKDRAARDVRTKALLAIGDAPCKPGPLPVEVLLAAVHLSIKDM